MRTATAGVSDDCVATGKGLSRKCCPWYSSCSVNHHILDIKLVPLTSLLTIFHYTVQGSAYHFSLSNETNWRKKCFFSDIIDT